MNRVISEIKARTNDLEAVRRYLESSGADYVGTDEQLDIYFQVDRGRLKLRRGSIENALIHYDRPNTNGMRESVVDLVKLRVHRRMGLLRSRSSSSRPCDVRSLCGSRSGSAGRSTSSET
ncbi:MAG: hypothetical protein R3E12_19350 [Candidatus Eisenbacteria bacterium]